MTIKEKNDLIVYIENNLKKGRIVFNKNSRDSRVVACWAFKRIPIENYEILLPDTIKYFKENSYIVHIFGSYIEIDDMYNFGR